MAFIASTDRARQLLAAKINDKENEKIIMTESVESGAIPTFSHSKTVADSNFCRYVTKITAKALIDIISEETPSAELLDSVLSDYAKSGHRFVPYNRRKLESYASRFGLRFQRLFTHEILRHFVACRKYFDVVGFRAFIDGIVRLREDLKMMLKHTSLNCGILSSDGLSRFIDEKIPFCDCLLRLQGEKGYVPFYKQTVLEQASFHLDPFGLNRMCVNDLMTSPHFAKFLDIDEHDRYDNPYSVIYFLDWFGTFSRTVNQSGLCTRESFKHCRNWHFCDAFVDRVFESSSLYDGCMDFGFSADVRSLAAI